MGNSFCFIFVFLQRYILNAKLSVHGGSPRIAYIHAFFITDKSENRILMRNFSETNKAQYDYPPIKQQF